MTHFNCDIAYKDIIVRQGGETKEISESWLDDLDDSDLDHLRSRKKVSDSVLEYPCGQKVTM